MPNKSKSMNRSISKNNSRKRTRTKNIRKYKQTGGAQCSICGQNHNTMKHNKVTGENNPNGGQQQGQQGGPNKGWKQQGQQNPQQLQQLQKLLKQQQSGQPTGQITPEQMALLTGQATGKPGKGQPQIYDPNKKLNNYLRHGTPVEPIKAPGKFTKGETMQKILKRIHKYVKKTHKTIKKKGKYPQTLRDRLYDSYGVIKRVYKTTKKTKPGK